MNYYKILHKDETHQKLHYTTGLNIDPLEFNPSGDCRPGGIYFSREDILAFIDYGPWIRKVTLPEDARVYKNPGKPRKWKADRIILGEREEINLEVIKRLIDEGADPKVDDSYALRWAAENGYLDIVKILLPLSDASARDNEALVIAARYGHLEIVKLLIPFSIPGSQNNEALRIAAKYGHYEIVKSLLPFSNSKMDNGKALQGAARYSHLEIVKLLLPVSEINNDITNYCRQYCENQEILDLIISSKN
ncbi:MAG: ankyrin repeat domain-containing protein [Sphaerochaetaceae bacterium]|nr:ankyrin repeat domain-containing protein [Sphaerochaetaceae bacterium]